MSENNSVKGKRIFIDVFNEHERRCLATDLRKLGAKIDIFFSNEIDCVVTSEPLRTCVIQKFDGFAKVAGSRLASKESDQQRTSLSPDLNNKPTMPSFSSIVQQANRLNIPIETYEMTRRKIQTLLGDDCCSSAPRDTTKSLEHLLSSGDSRSIKSRFGVRRRPFPAPAAHRESTRLHLAGLQGHSTAFHGRSEQLVALARKSSFVPATSVNPLPVVNAAPAPDSSGRSTIKVHVLKAPFLKLQDTRGRYKPMYNQFVRSPSIETLSTIVATATTTDEVCALPTVAAKRPPPRPRQRSYCDFCKCHMDEPRKHLATRQHQRNIRDENYVGIDAAIACGQTLSSFYNAYWRAESRDAAALDPACSQPDTKCATPFPSQVSTVAPNVVRTVTPCASVREVECTGSVSSVFRGFALDDVWDPFEPRYCEDSDDASFELRRCSPVFGATLSSFVI